MSASARAQVSADGRHFVLPDGQMVRRFVPDGDVLRRFMSSPSRVKIIQGPIGSGKSLGCAMSVWRKAQQQNPQSDGIRRCRAHIFRDTYGKLEETTIKTWLAWFPEGQFGKFYRSRPYRHEVRLPGIELDVHFVALEDQWNVDFFRSLETTVCWFNELQYMDRALVDEAATRVGRYPRVIDGGAVGPQVIGDMNAPDETHWVPIMRGDVAAPDWFTEDQRQAHRKPPTWEFFMQPPGLIEIKDGENNVTGYKPNPKAENTKFLEPGYYENAIWAKGKSWIDANVLNRVSARRDGKPVLRDFNRAMHVAKEPLRFQPGLKLLIGTDHGRRPCAIIGQYLRGRWSIVHELIARDMGADKFAPLLRKDLSQLFPDWEKDYQIYGDPSGDFKGQNDNQTPFQIFRGHGFRRIVPTATNLFTVRLQSMEAVFTRMSEGKPDILISPTCSMLIAALDGGWHFRRMKVSGERYAEEPEKDEYSDPADALGYLLLGGGEGRSLLHGGNSSMPQPIQTRRAFNPFERREGVRGF